MIIGQLAQCVKDKQWVFGVVLRIFDGGVALIKRSDGYTMYHHESGNESEAVKKQLAEGYTRLLFSNGKPVMAKRKLFRGYKLNINDYDTE
ncbi:hypothetical protein [Brevibacillus porteri]|uniref:hypothetical protein n=1 Tax=Brevibacillus porteri TaxID=2126350 RepID=UPI00363A5924